MFWMVFFSLILQPYIDRLYDVTTVNFFFVQVQKYVFIIMFLLSLYSLILIF